ncbi:hypothetical protein [uncultured Methanoregula sp.]|uniref:hypothetical protein n=1 Tax=uncultured Methanoregula sp. TaxID=1005933 RepID=UPI002AAA984B|nr:hypothetical protein [uncultured Methanoregula sp.]
MVVLAHAGHARRGYSGPDGLQSIVVIMFIHFNDTRLTVDYLKNTARTKPGSQRRHEADTAPVTG